MLYTKPKVTIEFFENLFASQNPNLFLSPKQMFAVNLFSSLVSPIKQFSKT